MTNEALKVIAENIGLSPPDIMYISFTAPKRYKVYEIPKRNGGTRTIAQPSRELKALQRIVVDNLLCNMPVHEKAMAYVDHRNIRDNAEIHHRSDVIVKLDFTDLFPSLKVNDWTRFLRARSPKWYSSEAAELTKRIFFWSEGGAQAKSLSIGAPSSPLISNLLMYNLDCHMAEIAEGRGAEFSRYADDSKRCSGLTCRGWL